MAIYQALIKWKDEEFIPKINKIIKENYEDLIK